MEEVRVREFAAGKCTERGSGCETGGGWRHEERQTKQYSYERKCRISVQRQQCATKRSRAMSDG